jgi:hypothetical protein
MAIASASTTMIAVSSQLDLVVLIPMLIQGSFAPPSGMGRGSLCVSGPL